MSFAEDLKRGSVGEQLFLTYINQQNLEYEDVRDLREYRLKDIDFIVDGIKYEIKTDYWYRRTGNLAVEDKAWHYEGYFKKGWYHYTEADYIVYAILPPEGSEPYYKGTLIFVPLGELKKIIQMNNIPQKTCKDNNKETDNWLVHVADYPYSFSSIEVYQF